MRRQIDRAELRRTIERAAEGQDAAVVSREWLEQVERELQELDGHQGREGDQK